MVNLLSSWSRTVYPRIYGKSVAPDVFQGYYIMARDPEVQPKQKPNQSKGGENGYAPPGAYPRIRATPATPRWYIRGRAATRLLRADRCQYGTIWDSRDHNIRQVATGFLRGWHRCDFPTSITSRTICRSPCI